MRKMCGARGFCFGYIVKSQTQRKATSREVPCLRMSKVTRMDTLLENEFIVVKCQPLLKIGDFEVRLW